ncbi:MAG: T9SS type A sorting domain-containing protein [Crocinitomicaceae bacterium]
MKKWAVLITFIFSCSTFDGFTQATHQVSHTSGMVNVAGIDVTVTKSGCRDVLYSYCPSVTSPYLVGFTLSPSSICNGTYTFQFSPPIELLALNFSGITNVPGHIEIVTLDVNGSHYPIPNAGSNNVCDDMAVLDANGNIAGCDGCIESGWKGTTITGPISELSVNDSVLVGSPSGTVFSLFISSTPASLQNNTAPTLQAFPNPFVNEIRFDAPYNGLISIMDSRGSLISTLKIGNGQHSIDTESFASGLYLVEFLFENGRKEFQKMIKL